MIKVLSLALAVLCCTPPSVANSFSPIGEVYWCGELANALFRNEVGLALEDANPASEFDFLAEYVPAENANGCRLDIECTDVGTIAKKGKKPCIIQDKITVCRDVAQSDWDGVLMANRVAFPFGEFSFIMIELKFYDDMRVDSWTRAAVLDGKAYLKNFAFPDATISGADVGSYLSLPNVASDVKSTPNIVNTTDSHKGHRYSSEKHQERPSGHIPLGYQIAFSAFVFVSGIYHSNNAFRLGDRIKAETGVLYLICGVTLIFLGMDILFANFLS